MTVTAVSGGPNSDLHILLESLNDLSSGPSRPNANIKHPLGQVHDSDGIWNQDRIINVEVKIPTWNDNMTYNDSLCDILDVGSQLDCYIGISLVCPGVESLQFYWAGRNHQEIKSMIDRWGQSLFLIPFIQRDVRASITMIKRL